MKIDILLYFFTGKPILVTSYSEQGNGKRCTLSISYPDIQEEKMNFVLEKKEIYKDTELWNEDFTGEVVFEIPWGQQHSICVSLFYKDLDNPGENRCDGTILAKAGRSTLV